MSQEAELISEISSLIGAEPEETPEVEEESELPRIPERPEEAETEAVSDDEAVEVEEPSDEVDPDEWDMKALAEEYDMTTEELYSTKVKFGEGREAATLGEIKDFYDANREGAKALQERLSALDKLAIEGKAARAAVTEYEPKVAAAQGKLTELESAWNAVDWEHIPEDQQATYRDYATQLQEGYKMAKLSFDNATAKMADSSTQLEQMQQAEAQFKRDAWQQNAAEEWPKIVEANPGWTDKAKAEAGMAELYGAFVEAGFSEEEAHQVTDSRLFKIAADALSYRNAGKIDLKEVKTRRKTVAGKGKLPKSIKEKRQAQKAMEAARDGSTSDKIAAITQLIS